MGLQPNHAHTDMECSNIGSDISQWNAASTKAYIHGHGMCACVKQHKPTTFNISCATSAMVCVYR